MTMQKSKSEQKREAVMSEARTDSKVKRIEELRAMPQKTAEQEAELKKLEGELEQANDQRLAHTAQEDKR